MLVAECGSAGGVPQVNGKAAIKPGADVNGQQMV